MAVNKYPLKKYPIVGVCGLNCGLCPRHYTEGKSRCPGCCGPGFWEKSPGCAFITCCVKKKSLETCAQCRDFKGCEKVARLLDSAKSHDSFISYKPVASNFALIQKNGIEEFARLQIERQDFLRYLISNYDDGRSRSFYCASCQLIPLDRLKEALANAETKLIGDTDIKEKAKIVRAAISTIAGALQIDLKLRK